MKRILKIRYHSDADLSFYAEDIEPLPDALSKYYSTDEWEWLWVSERWREILKHGFFMKEEKRFLPPSLVVDARIVEE